MEPAIWKSRRWKMSEGAERINRLVINDPNKQKSWTSTKEEKLISPGKGKKMMPATPPTEIISKATAVLDRPLHALGFEYNLISPQKVTGKLRVTETCCQPFGVLNGGVSALLAESVASLGAYVASGFRRVAGAQLSTNHIKAALLGDLVEVEAQPIQVGKTIQVWEVQLWKINPSTSGKRVLLSTSKITLVSNLPASDDMKGYEETVKKYAKL